MANAVTYQDSVVGASVSLLNDHLTILVNLIDRLDQAGELTDWMVATIHTTIRECIADVAAIQKSARAA